MEEWSVSRNAGDDHAEGDFYVGPDHDGLAVGVGLEVFDGEDADDLDDGDEEAEGEEGEEEEWDEDEEVSAEGETA